jgi:hypothetical protein
VQPQGYGGHRERHAKAGIAAGRKRPVQGQTNVVYLMAVHGQPVDGRARPPFQLSPFTQCALVFGVAARERTEFSAFAESLERIGTRRLEKPIVRNGTTDIRGDEGPGDQARQGMLHVAGGYVAAHRHCAGCFEGKRPGKDRQSPKHHPFVL